MVEQHKHESLAGDHAFVAPAEEASEPTPEPQNGDDSPYLAGDADRLAAAEWAQQNPLEAAQPASEPTNKIVPYGVGPWSDDAERARAFGVDSGGKPLFPVAGAAREAELYEHLRAMLKADGELYERILDTPGFAYHFNQICLMVRRAERSGEQ